MGKKVKSGLLMPKIPKKTCFLLPKISKKILRMITKYLRIATLSRCTHREEARRQIEVFDQILLDVMPVVAVVAAFVFYTFGYSSVIRVLCGELFPQEIM